MGSTKRSRPRKLGRKLKRIRLDLGLSQTQIAQKVGVKDRAMISQFESGKRQPSLKALLKYAELAGVSTDTLINDKLSLTDN